MQVLKLVFIISITAFVSSSLNAQLKKDSKAYLDSLYNSNIKKSRIHDVYIPKNLSDAHRRIQKLTPEDAIQKFIQSEDEVAVSKKLHFGIGRWMIHNWNFYEGSRFSHYLKQKGLLHPDDMAQFVLITLHRNLNEKPLNEEEVIQMLAIERKKEARSLIGN